MTQFIDALGASDRTAPRCGRLGGAVLALVVLAGPLAVAGSFPTSARLEGVPAGRGHWNAFAGALTLALKHSGFDVEYDTLMGDMGQAFILQASDQAPRIGGALDAGWWPLATDCAPALLERYGPVAGVELQWHGGDIRGYKADPDAYFARRLAPALKASVAAGRPALTNAAFWEVAVGYGEAPGSVLSFCPRAPAGERKIGRPARPPFILVTLGKKLTRLDRKQADLKALELAVALGRDRIAMPHAYRTGQKAFAIWAKTLRDFEHMGQARWHANVRHNLGLNRRSAVKYLEAMAKRRSKGTAAHLISAAKLYKRVLAELKKADTSEAAMKSKSGRERLAKLGETMAALELKAVVYLEKAVLAMGGAANAGKGEAVTEKTLGDLKHTPAWITHMGCLTSAADFLKIGASRAWVYGATGHAFALNVHEAICPSGPTAWAAHKCDELAANIGAKVERYTTQKNAKDFKTRQTWIWRQTRQAIDAGLPCFGWEMAEPEWYAVVGYDEAGHYLFRDLGRNPDTKIRKTHHTKLGDTGIGWACVKAVRRVKPADDRTTVRQALVFALANAAGKHTHGKYGGGLAGYDTWIRALGDAKLVKGDDTIGFGQAYNAQCWSECRHHALEFLREARRRLDDRKLHAHLDAAIKQYAVVAEQLGAVAREFPFDPSDEKATDARILDAKRRARAVAALEAARAAEVMGLESLAALARALGAEDAKAPVGASAKAYPEVLLADAVKAGRRIGSRTSKTYHQTRCFVTVRSICLTAAGADQADYETLMTVSGSGAGFAYHPKHAWVTYRPPEGFATAVKRMAQATGRQWEDLPPARSPDKAWDVLKQTIDSGRPLMGFHFMGEHVFCGYQDAAQKADRKVFLMGPFEYQGQWWSWKEFADWAKGKDNGFGRVGKKGRVRGVRTLALDVMKGMVAAAWRDGRAGARSIPSDVKFGLAGIEAFADDVADMGKKPDEFDGGWLGCHAVYPQVSGRKAAAVYLTRVADAFPQDVSEPMLAAAKAYGKAFAAWRTWGTHLGPASPAKTFEQLKARWRVKANREAGAAIMRQALAHERAAVGLVGKALAAARVKAPVGAAPATNRYPKVLIGDAAKAFKHITTKVASHELFTDRIYPYPQPCVYLVAHLTEMQAAGWKDVDFDTLAAVSGASALFAHQGHEFMPKYANLYIGMDQRIAEATGFGYEWVPFKTVDDAWRLVRQSVDSGRAVKGWDWENIVFAGYQDAQTVDARQIFAMTDGPSYYAKWITWAEFTKWAERILKWKQGRLGRHTRRVRKTAAKTIVLRVMKDLVAWSTKPPDACVKRFPRAAFGLAGIEAFAADMANVKKFDKWVMCHGVNGQWTVRHSTALYLDRVVKDKLVGKQAAEHVARAAKSYKAAFNAWHKAYGLMGHVAAKQQRRGKTRREAAAVLVREALEHERAAVAELKLALSLVPKRASA